MVVIRRGRKVWERPVVLSEARLPRIEAARLHPGDRLGSPGRLIGMPHPGGRGHGRGGGVPRRSRGRRPPTNIPAVALYLRGRGRWKYLAKPEPAICRRERAEGDPLVPVSAVAWRRSAGGAVALEARPQ